MKKLTFFFIPGLFIFIATTITACSLLANGDKCDATTETEIEVGIKAVVHVLDKNKNPISGQELKLYLYKKPCGAASKGQFDFSGPTNALGIRETSIAYYKLRNSMDEVWVDVYAIQLGNGSADADSEYATFKYEDFSPGFPKEVHVYIYRNF